MEPPEKDINDRTPVWDCLQDLYMDTDVALSYDSIVSCCARSKYSIEELEGILFNEVLPALRFNMFLSPAPEWAGFKTDWIVQRILEKHRYGKAKPKILRGYTNEHWGRLKHLIEIERTK